MKIDIWSDIVCPFCYIGTRHLQQALAHFDHADDVRITWHSFELDPTTERYPSTSLAQKVADKYGMSLEQSEASQRDVAARAAKAGLEFNWQDAKYGNTFDAHRLIHLAAQHGLANEAEEALMNAYFTQGVQIGSPEELQRIGEQIGLAADDVRHLLSSDEFADAVRHDETQARELGISGVPFFVFADKYAISGAQPVEVFSQALQQTWDETHAGFSMINQTAASAESVDDATCGDDGHCAV